MSSPEFMRLRQRHWDHIVATMRTGISMRTIRRHRLDDPRLTDEVRTVLVQAARERQRKQDRLPMLIRLASVGRNAASTGSHSESQAGSHL